MSFIKIQVVRAADGAHEVIILTSPVSVLAASNGGQSSMTTGTGMVHFFAEDGTYDGWETPFYFEVPKGEDPLESVKPAIQSIEADREILPPPEIS